MLTIEGYISDIPRGVRGGSEEVDTGQAGVSGQDRHHAACGAETSRIHADATRLVPQNGHHHLCRHWAWDTAEEQQSRWVLLPPPRVMFRGILGNIRVGHPHHHDAAVALCLPCSAVWLAPSWQAGSQGWTPEKSWTLLHRPTSPEPGLRSVALGAPQRPQSRWSAGWKCSWRPLRGGSLC